MCNTEWRMIIISKTEELKEKGNAINIRSIQADSIYRVNNGYENAYLDCGKAVLNHSLFSEYMKKHGMTVNSSKRKKNGWTSDFIVMKYDYKVKSQSVGDEQLKEISSGELREYFYTKGAIVPRWKKAKEGKKDTICYKMLMRNPGMAKNGACIFVCEELYKTAFDYITMGLYEKMPYENAKIVELSAYSTLVTATAIDFITLPLENIFVVKDEKVTCMKKAVEVKTKEVKYKKEIINFDSDELEEYINGFGFTFYKKKITENPSLQYISKTQKSLIEKGILSDECPKSEETYTKKECYVNRDNDISEVENTLWDGMGLIDESIFPDNMDGFIYCRSHFFKSCLFRGNIQEYFKDYYGENYDSAIETDMLGRKLKVSDIKVIVTENSLKWMKKEFIELMGDTPLEAYKYYDKFMKMHGQKFAIVKTAHSSKWGELQRSSYQINGSLPTTDKDILRNVAKESIDYCDNLKLNHDAFMKHLEITGSNYSINNVLIKLDAWNENFKYTEYFKDKKTDIISRFKNERLRLGKLFQYGDNLTICGNPIALLMKVTGKNFIEEPCFKQKENVIQCYTTRFKDGEKLAGFRSPHNSPNNIIYLENVYSDSIERYFPNLGNNVIIINGIGTDVQFRLNGQDLDTDGIYATNQVDIVELAKKAYTEYPTIINGIKPLGVSEYNKSMESYAKMDNEIFASQHAIGTSSNKAQLALSYYFDSGEQNTELQDVFIICSVLAQVAIDGSKRKFEIEVMPELARIGKMDCMQYTPKYPRFYADVQELKRRKSRKKYEAIKEDEIREFNCPMDILYRIIDKEVIDLRKYKKLNEPTYNLRTVFKYDLDKLKNRDRKQHLKIISIVEEFDKAMNVLDRDAEDYHENATRELEDCLSKIRNVKIKECTMYSLIAYAFYAQKKKTKTIGDRLLVVLCEKQPKDFLKCFEKTVKTPQKSDTILNLQEVSISAYEEGCERNVS